jgi:hypothetical protein
VGFPVKMASLRKDGLFSSVKKEIISSPGKFLQYATTLGLIKQGYESMRSRRYSLLGSDPVRNPVLALMERAKELYQEYF